NWKIFSMRRLNLKIVLHLLGMQILITEFFMLVSVLVSVYFDDGLHCPVLVSSVIVAVLGATTYFSTINPEKKVGKREGYLVVGIGWIVLVLTGVIPYLISIPYLPEEATFTNRWNFTNLIFETMSGYTTTGSTIFDDIE